LVTNLQCKFLHSSGRLALLLTETLIQYLCPAHRSANRQRFRRRRDSSLVLRTHFLIPSSSHFSTSSLPQLLSSFPSRYFALLYSDTTHHHRFTTVASNSCLISFLSLFVLEFAHHYRRVELVLLSVEFMARSSHSSHTLAAETPSTLNPPQISLFWIRFLFFPSSPSLYSPCVESRWLYQPLYSRRKRMKASTKPIRSYSLSSIR